MPNILTDLKLHLPHRILVDTKLNLIDGETTRFVAVWLINDNAYATYAVDGEGNCYWGHYGLSRDTALHDIANRSGLNTVTEVA